MRLLIWSAMRTRRGIDRREGPLPKLNPHIDQIDIHREPRHVADEEG
jgi:hypothetical protein